MSKYLIIFLSVLMIGCEGDLTLYECNNTYWSKTNYDELHKENKSLQFQNKALVAMLEKDFTPKELCYRREYVRDSGTYMVTTRFSKRPKVYYLKNMTEESTNKEVKVWESTQFESFDSLSREGTQIDCSTLPKAKFFN